MIEAWRDESFNGTRIESFRGWVRITVPGYQPFVAMPQDDSEYRHRAFSLGFMGPEDGRTDAEAMNYEHDRSHAMLAKMLGLRVSPVLDWLARGQPKDEGASEFVRDAEEQFILAFHRYKNALIHAGLWRRQK